MREICVPHKVRIVQRTLRLTVPLRQMRLKCFWVEIPQTLFLLWRGHVQPNSEKSRFTQGFQFLWHTQIVNDDADPARVELFYLFEGQTYPDKRLAGPERLAYPY